MSRCVGVVPVLLRRNQLVDIDGLGDDSVRGEGPILRPMLLIGSEADGVVDADHIPLVLPLLLYRGEVGLFLGQGVDIVDGVGAVSVRPDRVTGA